MRRLFVLVLFIVIAACRQEQKTPPATGSQKPAAPPASTQARKTPPPAPPKMNQSTPDRCAGDGSYAQAVECFRSTSRLVFSIEEAKGIHAEGELDRTTLGAEREKFTLHGSGPDDGTWTAEAKASGVMWTRNGKRVTGEPAVVDRMWQRTALYVDPQKKDGEPSRDFTVPISGEQTIPYRFTDANNGDVHEVWVDTRDGHIAQIKVESHGAFPSYTMKISKMGK